MIMTFRHKAKCNRTKRIVYERVLREENCEALDARPRRASLWLSSASDMMPHIAFHCKWLGGSTSQNTVLP